MNRSKMEQITLENVGNNSGAIVGINNGTLFFNSNNVEKIPSLISKVVKAMADLEDPYASSNLYLSNIPFTPEEKIKYNSVVKYKDIIKEYSTYYIYCEEILNVYDNSNIGSKSKILRCVRNWYLEEKGELLKNNQELKLNEIEIIRANSDYLVDLVKGKIYDISMRFSNVEDLCVEDIELGVICFTCYCFMECKILEKPL